MPIQIIPGEFTPFTIAIAILSGFIIFFGYISMFIKEKCFLSEAFVALIVGIIAGPLVSNGINPYSWADNDEITKQITRCIIGIQVLAVGIELPKHYMKKEWVSMLVFLIPVMIFMWLISGLFIWWLIPPLNYLDALVIAACVCPTDPILANSVVKGRFAEKHVPAHIRNVLSAESGANDGMGFPFLFLAIFLLSEDNVGTAIGKWVYMTCLFQIALSCVIGIVVGWAARKMLQWSERNHLIDKPSFLCFAIALALFLLSMTGFSGSDDVLACFAAGNAFSWDDWFRQETEEAHFQEVIDMMLNLAVFVYIGAIIPWSDFGNEEIGLTPWRLVVIAILILLFRRLPVVLALKPIIPAMKTYREAMFSGWFGPMGVGAVFLSKIAKEEMEQVYSDATVTPVSIRLINPVVLFIVLASTLVHGTTIPLFKIGNRIRTRTLSITSTGSSQVLRLPKLKSSSNNRRNDDDSRSRSSRDTPLSQLQRNTLMNTIHHERSDNADGANYAIDMNNDEGSDDDMPEVDFLPESDDEATQQSVSDKRQEQTHMPESQSIRFLEPVKPRGSTPSNAERNEASVSSFKSWRHRNNSKEEDQNEEAGASSNTGGLRALFRRQKDLSPKDENIKMMFSPHSEKQAEQLADAASTQKEADAAEQGYHSPQQPQIEVWEEDGQIIIEDTADTFPNIIIDKSDPHRKQKTKEAITEMEQAIQNMTKDSASS